MLIGLACLLIRNERLGECDSFALSMAFHKSTKGARLAGCVPEAVVILTEALLSFLIHPLVRVSGGPYERGRLHGRACGDLIRRYPDFLLQVIGVEGRWRALDRASAPGK